MRTLYLYILDTLSDWETGNVMAELRSGRYLKNPALRYSIVLCGSTLDSVTTMGGLHLTPEVLITGWVTTKELFSGVKKYICQKA